MKTLLLMRHAKSSHEEEGLSDHDRPLNDRGRREAPLMARRLADAALLPDLVLSSTAVRAKATAELVASEMALPHPVRYSHWLYHASPRGILDVIASEGGAAERVLVVGHNPGMEQLVARLTGWDGSMTTSAIAIVNLAISSWSVVSDATSGRLVEVWKPSE